MLTRRPANAQRGVTLIEAMITITLLAIIIMLALPGLQHWLKNARIRTTSEEVMAGLQLARSEAVRSNCTAEFALGAGGGWTVTRLTNCPVGGVVQSRPAVAAVGEVTITPTPAGAAKATFNALGQRIANVDGSDVLTSLVVDLPVAVLASGETRELQIDISLNGQIRLCDPKVIDLADTRYCL